MERISILVGLGILVFSIAAWSEPCPEVLKDDPDADQDGDGLLNKTDRCCFTANLDFENSAPVHCGRSDPSANDNGNHELRKEEGQCCVKSQWQCGRKDAVNSCPDDSAEVACDKLLSYGEEPGSFDCPDSECLCFTVGDFDQDDSGPFDNCPLSQMSDGEGGQTNEDGDIWGQECDPCSHENDGLTGTSDGHCHEGMSCGPQARCVPFVTIDPNFGGINVLKMCSSPPDPDRDGWSQSCDNCPDVWNRPQHDADGDGWGDACDGCPYHPDTDSSDTDDDGIWNACDSCNNLDQAIVNPDEIEDDDDDGIPDDCDNCPFDYDSAQADTDHDGVGDLCDNCPGEPNRAQSDADGDGIGDRCDMCPGQDDDTPMLGEDRDRDGIWDECDFCPGQLDYEVVLDLVDQDSDRVHDECDVCPGYDNRELPFDLSVASELLTDEDDDGVADICDACLYKQDDKATIGMPDQDSDGVPNYCDMCPDIQNTQAAVGEDKDGDGIWDECDELVNIDTDEPSVDTDTLVPRDTDEPSVDTDTPVPRDTDEPSVDSDAPDPRDTDDADKWLLEDKDDDGVVNGDDNCPEEYNPEQFDYDEDGAGDACSPFDDYSGAFNCRCNSIGANGLTHASSLEMLVTLLI